MKGFLLFLILSAGAAKLLAQNGLEQVIVERYYVSDAKDEKNSNGNLEAGSVTYRIFVDLLPKYRFQAVYGIPGHELKINSTRNFYNDNSLGALLPNAIPQRSVTNGTLMLDSWVSVGACSEFGYGVLKADDSTQENPFNGASVLQNKDKSAGFPVCERDGMLEGAAPRVTIFGIEKELEILNRTASGTSIQTSNGSWASLYGSVGADSLGTNRVLIGQFTTKGDFSFELNIQIGTPSGKTENYVALNPVNAEIQLPSLIYNSAEKKSSESKKKKKNI